MQQFSQAQWPQWAYSGGDVFPGYSQLNNYPSYFADSMETAYRTQQHHLVQHQQLARTTESKPRLSKEEVEILEAEFQKNHKPSSTIKKALAESMRVENARINNWFQNRRAREKKENNIRQYEARQKLERTGASPDSASDGDRASESVASTAPFPGRRETSLSEADTPDTADGQSNDAEEDSCEDLSGLPSPIVSSQLSTALGDTSADYFLATQQEAGELMDAPQFLRVSSKHAALGTPDLTRSLSDSETLAHTNGQSPDYFGTYATKFNSVYASDLNADDDMSDASVLHHHLSYEFPGNGGSRQSSQLSSSMDDLHPKSHSTIDIASRRNRRPPALAISGARSYSNGLPKTATDFLKNGDLDSAMRRVASSTGASRVAKSTAVPRSPFFERKHETMLHLNRSPGLSGPRTAIAPPTPNTPMLTSNQGFPNGFPPTLSPGDKFSSAELAAQDPTLRTPPTTPGDAESLQNLNASYNMSLSDGALMTPGLSHFPGDFQIPNLHMSIPGYLHNGNSGSSQADSALYVSQGAPAYFTYPNGHGEYNWSDASPSEHSSPGQMTAKNHLHEHYRTNM